MWGRKINYLSTLIVKKLSGISQYYNKLVNSEPDGIEEVVVAGGHNGVQIIDTVEIFSMQDLEWRSGKKRRNSISMPASTVD